MDDMLVLTEQQSLMSSSFQHWLASTSSVHGMKDSGDSFDFLKRIHTMVDHETFHTLQNPHPFDKLFETVGVQNSMQVRRFHVTN